MTHQTTTPHTARQPRDQLREAQAVLKSAGARTHSPSDRLAFALDQALLEHPERLARAADYPGWIPGRRR
ncbi:hypothetical protein [Streptomyces sp. WMMB303]|uniref:hypothetical protein n=1 Tax=Streptomyces sp. WMMB303 TaxID=3034154 RepID=UPI0023ED0361|nr:hypothetical protein [Streptomyces sp. WMMB303]MDF4254621.1 hypothetical protein [Streptomyces sp. WMMB303]